MISRLFSALCAAESETRFARSVSGRGLVEIAPIVHPDRQTRRLVRRQIVDDVRDLVRSSTVPTGDAALDYVKRLRSLGEIGGIESSRFWQLAYQLCGSSCSLVVFTRALQNEPRVAMTWMSVYLSRLEQVRVLEKALPAISGEVLQVQWRGRGVSRSSEKCYKTGTNTEQRVEGCAPIAYSVASFIRRQTVAGLWNT